MDVTYFECERSDSNGTIPIGRPIANTQLYILDRALQTVPIGVAGELYIGGVGLARGYLGRPGLTAERFIASPFGEVGERLYRTGDRCRYRADGNLEFLGRLDHQVKIRGVRIELGEIETLLRQHPDVADAVVLDKEGIAGDRVLVAYVAVPENARPGAGELREYLVQWLPDVMLPVHFVFLDAFPVTANGKLDRAALPAPDWSPLPQRECVGPRTPIEEAVAAVWAEVLGIETLSVFDDFFELGGHSLLAMQVVAQVCARLSVDVPLYSLFWYPTIASFSAHLSLAPAEKLAAGF